MKLYDSRLAPNPRRVRWFMAEKGITDIEVDSFDLFEGRQKSKAYLEEVGVPNVPALVLDSGDVITESIAICRYLEAIYPQPNLFGRDPLETAQVEMWLRRAELLTAYPLMLAVRHGHPALAALESQIPELCEANKAQAHRSLGLFERRLGAAEWLAGDRVTMADGVLFIGFEFARMVKFRLGEDTPNLLRWQAAMRERESAPAGT
ncbi:MAG TPA: glutathione S-transferase family protein [Caulobacteraceae bacterium]|jgi:glutathione S-transferase|nr:glutathione S-transferase family protein [Caulobacteraceae bacterium]